MFNSISQIQKEPLTKLEQIFGKKLTEFEIIKLQTEFPEFEQSTLSEMTKIKTGKDEFDEKDEPHINGLVWSLIDEIVLGDDESFITKEDGYEYVTLAGLKDLEEIYDDWYAILYDLPVGDYEYNIRGKTVIPSDAILVKQRLRQITYFINKQLPMKVTRIRG